jgi:hypothetical protein
MLSALTKALTIDSPEATRIAERAGLRGRPSFGRRATASPAALLATSNTNPWVHLASGTVASKKAEAEWFLLRSARGVDGARRRDLAAAGRKGAHGVAVSDAVNAGELVEVTDHPFLTMLAMGTEDGPPWIQLSGMQVDRLEAMTIDAVGSFYYLIFRDPVLGHPVRWWPLPVLEVDPPTPTRPDFRFGGEFFEPEDVAWFRVPRISDPYGSAAGRVEAAAHEVNHQETMSDYLAALLDGGALMRHIIMAPGLGTTEFERFKNEFHSIQGAKNAGASLILGYPEGQPGSRSAGVTVKELDHSPADMDSESSLKNRRDDILQVLGVPPAAIGQTDDANRASSLVSRESLRENRIHPDLEARRSWLQSRFFMDRMVKRNGRRVSAPPEYPGGWILDFRLRPMQSADDRLEMVTSIPGDFTRNERRSVGGFGAIEGQDELEVGTGHLDPEE